MTSRNSGGVSPSEPGVGLGLGAAAAPAVAAAPDMAAPGTNGNSSVTAAITAASVNHRRTENALNSSSCRPPTGLADGFGTELPLPLTRIHPTYAGPRLA